MGYNLSIIHKLIITALFAEDIEPLLLYHPDLKPICNKFGSDMSFETMAHQAVTYCHKYELIEILLELIKEKNPKRYRQFEPDLRNHITQMNPITKVQRQRILFSLDRKKHSHYFEQKLEQVGNGAAAFLLHGQADCGQDILRDHLIHLATKDRILTEHKRIPIDMGSRGGQANMGRIWRGFNASITGYKGRSDENEIMDNLLRLLKTKDCTIIVNDIGRFPANFFENIVSNFWAKLVAKTKTTLEKHQTRLILLLVDWNGTSETWPGCLDHSTEMFNPKQPIRLPPCHAFSHADLKVWLTNISRILPPGCTIETVLKETENGIPNFVYDWINDLCENVSIGEMAHD